MKQILRKAFFIVLSCLIISGCAAPLKKSGGDNGKFTFKWECPGEVIITDEAVKKGKSAKLRYKLRLHRKEGETNLRLSWLDFEILEVEGRPVTPIEKMMLTSMGVGKTMYSDFIISPEGIFLEVDNIEKTVDATVNLLQKASRNPDALKDMEKMKHNEQLKEVMTNATKQLWMAWAEAWIGMDLDKGQVVRFEGKESVLSGMPGIRMRGKIENLGESSEYPGKVHLRITTEPDSKESLRFIAGFVKQFSSKQLSPKEVEQMKDAALKCKSVVETIIDPYTLKPSRVFREKDIAVSAPGAGGAKMYESHTYHFEWAEE